MPHAILPSPGLQALVLCGPGLSLNTFTSNPSAFPKALIPIANRPMVWYSLDWCYRAGITDITLITPPESAGPLEAALSTHPDLTSLPNPKPEIVAPKTLEQNSGTGDVLRCPEIQNVIQSDFIVLPCDFISELDGSHLVQQWMTLNSSKSVRKGGLAVYYTTQGLEGISNKKDETDFVATAPIPPPVVPPLQSSLRPHIEQVVLAMPTDTLNDTLEENKHHLPIRHALYRKHSRVRMRTKHRDAHVYIFPQWVKDFVAKNGRFDSISEDVLGWWAKASWQDGLVAKLGLDEILRDKPADETETNGFEQEDDIDASALSTTKSSTAPAAQKPPPSSPASRVGTSATPTSLKPVIVPPLLAYIQPNPQPLIRRVDTAALLSSVSLYLARQPPTTGPSPQPTPHSSSTPSSSLPYNHHHHPLAHDHKLHPTATVGLQARISAEDSLIAANVRIGSRCNIKESVVGANCEIGNNVRLVKCVLMEGVVVGDGVQMVGCIVGQRARVEGVKAAVGEGGEEGQGEEREGPEGEKKKGRRKGGGKGEDEEGKTRLTDCEVAPNFVVEAGTEAKGETLKAFDADAMEDVEDEDDGEDEGELEV